MTPLADVLERIAADLDALGARYALVGGLAVSVRTQPRFTRDIDLAVSVASDEQAESLVHDLQGRGMRLLAHLEQTATDRMASVRLTGLSGSVVDLLFASSGIEPEIVAAAEPLEVLPGVTLPVASVPHLLALKVLSRDDRARPQDRADALALAGAASEVALQAARQALELIEARGYARGRDLQRELERLLDEAGIR